MDKELLAKKLYCKRVSSLMGDAQLDDNVLDEMWDSKTSPSNAVKTLQTPEPAFEGAPWLSRYLNRK
ncbi:hypothetical protein KI655_21090 [Vibrio sp. D404a]|uniref:hypothetical protein n=1 Tax=unclassified Vibrio TaxID=2614977 RepID=UPI002553B0E8|nr:MULTISPECIES: hypothetical protein [unclassified Vibrio]MDK9739793.1 hypothetical protein [Vibrio sp. D404a]MDK9797119.1 hypothetical protein [Vibrio sp. D449a]